MDALLQNVRSHKTIMDSMIMYLFLWCFKFVGNWYFIWCGAIIGHLVVKNICIPCAYAPALLPAPLSVSLYQKPAAEEVCYSEYLLFFKIFFSYCLYKLLPIPLIL